MVYWGVHILEIVSMSTPNATAKRPSFGAVFFAVLVGFAPVAFCSYAGARYAPLSQCASHKGTALADTLIVQYRACAHGDGLFHVYMQVLCGEINGCKYR